MRTRNLSDDGLNLFNIAICNGKNIKHNADSYKRYSDIKDMPVKTYCYSKIKQLLHDIRLELESDGFITKIKSGKNYNDMINVSDKI